MQTISPTPPPKPVVRDATAVDVDVIVTFNRRMAQETEGKDLPLDVLRPGVRAVIENPGLGRYFVACRDGEVVGQLMLTIEWSDWRNGQIWWIQSVYVRPEHRRGGVFRALYQHVEQLGRRTPGVVGLRLYVEHQNVIAQGVYKALAMRDAGYVVFERMWSE